MPPIERNDRTFTTEGNDKIFTIEYSSPIYKAKGKRDMFSKSEGNIQAGSTIGKTSKFSPASFAEGVRSGKANKRSRGSVGKNASASRYDSGKVQKLTPDAQSAKRLEKLSRSVFIGTFITIAAVAFALISITSSQAAVTQATGNTKQVLVASQEIPAGTTISSNMVSAKDIPSAYVSSNSYADVGDVVGKTTATAIGANSQISGYMVSASENTSSLAAKIPAGNKAVSVNVSSNNGVSNLLRCGDKVNVYSANSSTDSMRKIADEVLVLALDSTLSGPEASTTYSTVTLQVTEAQSEEIIDAQTSDTIFLTLNSLADASNSSNGKSDINTYQSSNLAERKDYE